jgi:hypothetical protein
MLDVICESPGSRDRGHDGSIHSKLQATWQSTPKLIGDGSNRTETSLLPSYPGLNGGAIQGPVQQLRR